MDGSGTGGVESFISDFIEFSTGNYYLALPAMVTSNSFDSKGKIVFDRLLPRALKALPDLRQGLSAIRALRQLPNSVSKIIVHRLVLVPVVKLVCPKLEIVVFQHNDFRQQWSYLPWAKKVFKLAALWTLERFARMVCKNIVILGTQAPGPSLKAFEGLLQIGACYNDRIFSKQLDQGLSRSGIAWVGRLVEVKNPELAIEAFEFSAKRHNESLLLIGSGKLGPTIRSRADSSPFSERITLMEKVSRQQLANILSSSLLLLQTSRSEAAPRTVLEALVCGCSVVSTSAGDPEDLIGQLDAGSRVGSQNASELGEAVLRAVSSRHCFSLELLANRKASRFMPWLEERLKLI